jgi:hypothetical protein
MPGKVRRGFAAIAAVSALLVAHPVAAQDRPTDRGLNLFDMCFKGSARMSDKCYGFIGAIVEIVETEQLVSTDRRFSPPICIPPGLKVADIWEAIGQPLSDRVFSCAGVCTATSYVISTLAAVYPCKE